MRFDVAWKLRHIFFSFNLPINSDDEYMDGDDDEEEVEVDPDEHE